MSGRPTLATLAALTAGSSGCALGESRLLESRAVLLAFAAGLVLVGFGVASIRTAAAARRERELARLVEERTRALLDVTRQLAEANRKAQELSLRDGLTGVANRRHFDSNMKPMWAHAQRRGVPISLLMIDVDHFKRYNDSLGHLAGDQCLIFIAQLLQGRLRRASDLLARVGGEEFAILLDSTPLPAAVVLAETLREAVEAAAIAHPTSDVAPVVTISIGIATRRPGPADPAEDLSAAADRALYRAKAEGRNRVVAAER